MWSRCRYDFRIYSIMTVLQWIIYSQLETGYIAKNSLKFPCINLMYINNINFKSKKLFMYNTYFIYVHTKRFTKIYTFFILKYPIKSLFIYLFITIVTNTNLKNVFFIHFQFSLISFCASSYPIFFFWTYKISFNFIIHIFII